MAQTKGTKKDANIKMVNPATVDVEGEDMEIAASALQSVTTKVPHEADASSAPGPYNDLDVNRPPVSTNRPDVPIAHSLVAGAGAPTGPPEYKPELGPDQDEERGIPAVVEAVAKAEEQK